MQKNKNTDFDLIHTKCYPRSAHYDGVFGWYGQPLVCEKTGVGVFGAHPNNFFRNEDNLTKLAGIAGNAVSRPYEKFPIDICKREGVIEGQSFFGLSFFRDIFGRVFKLGRPV